jgi:hypothetical protein
LGALQNTNLEIRNNTIASSTAVINITQASFTTTIAYNNFENYGQCSIYSNSASNITATNNWWGTTDTQTINQSIHDKKNDYNLGTVDFVPFLTEVNSQAMPDPNAPIPTPLPSSTPTQSPLPSQSPTEPASPTLNPSTSPDQSSVQGVSWGLFYGVVAVLVVAVTVLSVAVAVLLRRTRKATYS